MGICECGCGESPVTGDFLPGHDQRLRTSVEARAGGLLALRELVDAAERYAEAQSGLVELGESVRRILRKNRDGV